MPPPWQTPVERRLERPETPGPISGWVRGALAGIGLGLIVVFALAIYLDPYQADGRPRQMATHQQLGLPPCTFWMVSGLPCPSCGMTTSFALLVRGDLVNSVRANVVGTLLACFGLVLLPWCVVSVVRRQTPFVHSLERTATYLIVGFLGLAILRWAIVLAFGWPI